MSSATAGDFQSEHQVIFVAWGEERVLLALTLAQTFQFFYSWDIVTPIHY